MQEQPSKLGGFLVGLKQEDWVRRLARIAESSGYFQKLDANHFATYIDGDSTLLVSFETMDNIRASEESGNPLGWQLVKDFGWSNLTLISEGETWFRAPKLYQYFDRLSDSGFFERYDRVVFFGAGACGYAAAAFSVAAPGATVICVAPHASQDPDVAGWDPRFPSSRRLNFNDRYGFAPDMLEAAKAAYVIYDPKEPLDAMHASLFRGSNVRHLPAHHFGSDLQTHLLEMQLLFECLAQAADGDLTRSRFGRILRARRDYPPYLGRLLAKLEQQERTALITVLCINVTSRMSAPKFSRRLRQLTKAQKLVHR